MAFVKVMFDGREVSIWDSFGPRDHAHKFTEEELAALADGKTIAFNAVSKAGKDYVARGYLGETERGFGFIMDFDAHIDADFTTEDILPSSWGGVVLTDDDKQALLAGKRVYIEGATSKSGGTYNAYLSWEDDPERPGHKHAALSFDD